MKYLFIACMLLSFASCNGQTQSKAVSEPHFEMVTVPTLITEPSERAAYLAQHYWDRFDFKDTAFIHYDQVTEQALTDYLSVLGNVPLDKATQSIKDMLVKAEADSAMFSLMTDLYEKYLYSANSPMRNDELYIPVLQSIIAASFISADYKLRPESLLALALKNRVHQPAIDFKYTLANGTVKDMYALKADYLILFFNNPECEACGEMTERMKNSASFNALIAAHKLVLLSVYADADVDEWKNHLSMYPDNWIKAYDKDQAITNGELYDLKASPTVYLLDKDKTVLIKDATYQQLEDYFARTDN